MINLSSSKKLVINRFCVNKYNSPVDSAVSLSVATFPLGTYMLLFIVLVESNVYGPENSATINSPAAKTTKKRPMNAVSTGDMTSASTERKYYQEIQK